MSSLSTDRCRKHGLPSHSIIASSLSLLASALMGQGLRGRQLQPMLHPLCSLSIVGLWLKTACSTRLGHLTYSFTILPWKSLQALLAQGRIYRGLDLCRELILAPFVIGLLSWPCELSSVSYALIKVNWGCLACNCGPKDVFLMLQNSACTVQSYSLDSLADHFCTRLPCATLVKQMSLLSLMHMPRMDIPRPCSSSIVRHGWIGLAASRFSHSVDTLF